ncbi:HAD domain-containing protein [Paraburkholderia phenoliruptrix]|uniref:HAD domain-containing protein n=1 Tax=Paraburkholderia phenoliruptrix TaxID=252970 RepID=UPI0035A83521
MYLYLALEGVLHPIAFPNDVEPTLAMEAQRSSVLAQGARLAQVLGPFPEVRIVLNTWWSYYLGENACRKILPRKLATRVVGCVLARPERWESIPDRLLLAERHINTHGLQQCFVLDHIHARYSKAVLSRVFLLQDPSRLHDSYTIDVIIGRLRALTPEHKRTRQDLSTECGHKLINNSRQAPNTSC